MEGVEPLQVLDAVAAKSTLQGYKFLRSGKVYQPQMKKQAQE